jgi:hypothetical protein
MKRFLLGMITLPCRMLAVFWLLLTVTQLSKAVETPAPTVALAAEFKAPN